MKGRQNVSNRRRIDVHQHLSRHFGQNNLAAHDGDPSGACSGDPLSKVLPRPAAGLAGPLVDYPFDTTRTAIPECASFSRTQAGLFRMHDIDSLNLPQRNRRIEFFVDHTKRD
jgi:hypothetical protein